MKSIHSFTDKHLFLFFLFGVVIATIVFTVRYFNYVHCETLYFETKADDYAVNEIFRFQGYNIMEGAREWDFGDSTAIDTRNNPSHIYKYPGQYVVTLKANRRCEYSQTLTIREQKPVFDSTKLARFTIPKTITVGDTLRPLENTPGAKRWEWRFGETREVNSTEKNPEYVFKGPGLKTVTLITDGDIIHHTSKRILVEYDMRIGLIKCTMGLE